jgi:hypothetical protein
MELTHQQRVDMVDRYRHQADRLLQMPGVMSRLEDRGFGVVGQAVMADLDNIAVPLVGPEGIVELPDPTDTHCRVVLPLSRDETVRLGASLLWPNRHELKYLPLELEGKEVDEVLRHATEQAAARQDVYTLSGTYMGITRADRVLVEDEDIWYHSRSIVYLDVEYVLRGSPPQVGQTILHELVHVVDNDSVMPLGNAPEARVIKERNAYGFEEVIDDAAGRTDSLAHDVMNLIRYHGSPMQPSEVTPQLVVDMQSARYIQ